MFSRSSPSIPQDDEPNLEVTVTPIASAFYAGETFSAVISFRNNRRSGSRRTLAAQSVPTTPEPNHGLHWLPGTGLPSPASETESQTTTISPERAWSPASQTWREHARRPSGKGHTRRTQSLALGKGTLSPQEMVWALGGGSPSQRKRTKEGTDSSKLGTSVADSAGITTTKRSEYPPSTSSRAPGFHCKYGGVGEFSPTVGTSASVCAAPGG